MRVKIRAISKLLGIISLAFFIGGCYSEKGSDENLAFSGIAKVNVAPAVDKNTADSLAIQVKGSTGNIVSSYNKLSEIPTAGVTLNAGDYEVVATPTNRRMPLFERPIFAGTATFKITANNTSTVSIALKPINFAVGVSYSDKFKTGYTSYSTKISSADGSITFGANETRLGYFHSGPLTITVSYTDGNGVKQAIQQTIDATSASITPGSKLMLYFKHASEDAAGDLTGYYQNASGKKGIELKNALATIISTGYIAKTYGDLWTAYLTGDIRTDGTGAIWDVYSDIPTGKAPYFYQPVQNQCGSYSGEGSCYNREHTIPKSWFNEDTPMYSDYLHILPTDGYVNGRRSNFPYGEVATATWTSKNGSKLGNAPSTLGYTKTVFEPIDAYKGDIARIYFYFVTRYADRLKTYDNTGTTEEVFNANDYGLDKWVVDMFLRWSKNDPVSQKEITRNTEAEKFQKNRNPYVDHPEFIDMIWGSTTTKSITKKAGFTYVYIKMK